MKKTLFMIAMIACFAMVFIDESGIAVVLPSVQKVFHLTENSIHWIINSYLLVLSVLLLLGGKLSDLFGHKRIFTIGIVIFSIGSLICGLSSNDSILISGRAIQGIGASLLMPCMTVLVQHVFQESFGKAFGVILSFSNLFYALGPFIGGAITEYLTWQWFFLLNIPVGMICLLFTYMSVKEDLHHNIVKFKDYKGLVLFILTLSFFIIGLMQGGEWGWSDLKTITCFLLTIIGLIIFVLLELKTAEPVLDINLFRIKRFSAGNIVLLCSVITLTVIVFLALWLQKSLGFSPTTVGLALLPSTLTFIFIPTIGGHWQEKVGLRIPTLTGTLLILFGMIWITVSAYLNNYFLMLPGLISFGLGLPLAIPGSINIIMTSVKPEQSGVASGVFTTVRQFALSIGIAVFSAAVSTFQNFSGTYGESFVVGMVVMSFIALIGTSVVFKYVK